MICSDQPMDRAFNKLKAAGSQRACTLCETRNIADKEEEVASSEVELVHHDDGDGIEPPDISIPTTHLKIRDASKAVRAQLCLAEARRSGGPIPNVNMRKYLHQMSSHEFPTAITCIQGLVSNP